MPDYGDVVGGLPPDWAPDPNWAPPESWGYAPAPAPAPVLPDVQPGVGVPSSALDAAASPPPEPLPPVAEQQLPAIPIAPESAPPPGIGPPNIGFTDPFAPQSLGQIAPDQLDVSPTTFADQWQADPLHAPDNIARSYIEQASPLDLADQRRRIEEAKSNKLILDQAAIDEQNVRDLKANQAARERSDSVAQIKSDQIVADATKLARTKIDPGRLMSTRSAGQRVAGFISAVVGGLVQGQTGSAHNIGMDIIQREIDRDIDAQKADIENGRYEISARQNAVAQEFKRSGNLFDAAETVRLATYQAATHKMLTEQQNFDPKGTQWLSYGSQINDMQARTAAHAEQVRQTIFGERLKVEQFSLEQQKVIDARRRAEQENQRGWAAIANTKAAQADNVILTPAQIAQQFPNFPVAAIPPGGATLRDLSARADLAQKAASGAKTSQEAVTAARANDPNERNRELAVPGIVDDKGSVALFRSKEAADKAAISKGTVDDVARMTDELIGMVRKNGFSTNFAKSPEWQRAQQTYASILLKAKEEDKLGALSQSDYDIIAKKVGTTDPTQLRDTVDGMKSFRHNLVEGFNTAVRNQVVLPQGSELKRWEPKSLDVPEAAPTAADAMLLRLKAKPDEGVDDVRAQAVHDWLAEHTELPRNQQGQVAWTDEVRTATKEIGDNAVREREQVTPIQRRDIAALQAAARAGDRTAVAYLQDVAASAHSKRVRQLAEQAISQAQYREITVQPGPSSEPVRIPDLGPAQPTFPAGP